MKDKHVYARNKSGYIFPANVQIKIMHASGKDDDEKQGGTFIGIIKLDRKLINSKIAYLIIDKDKKIIAISSSCITLLYLDLARLERLTSQGVTLNTFCQDIQLKKDSEKPFLVTWNAEICLER